MLLVNKETKECCSYRYDNKEEMENHIEQMKQKKYEVDFISIKKRMAVFSQKIK